MLRNSTRRGTGQSEGLDAQQGRKFVEIHTGHCWQGSWSNTKPGIDNEVRAGVNQEADNHDARELCQGAGRGYLARYLVGRIESPEKSESGKQQDNNDDRCPRDGHGWLGLE